MKPLQLPRTVFAVTASVAATLVLSDTARTQARPVAPAPITMGRPDVQIVVLPLPTGYAVSSVYPRQVTKAEAQGRITRLIALTKWKATNRRFSDATAPSNLLKDGAGGLLSAASFETTNIVFGANGTIDIEPFLQAFGDLRRVNLIFFTGDGFVYQGATAFDNDRIQFSATQGQGTVTITANIKTPASNAAPFGVPSVAPQVVTQTAPETPAPGRGGSNRWLGLFFVAVAAVGFGIVIYSLTLRFAQKP